MKLEAGRYQVLWVNPSNGESIAGDAATFDGGLETFGPPFTGEAVLLLTRE